MSDKLNTATVYSVESDGLRLIFPDSSEPSVKRYPCNRSVTFTAGDRVFLIPTASSYVVAFPL